MRRRLQEMLGIKLLGAIPEDTQVIISTNRGEPLVLQKKLTLSGIAFERAARNLIGRKVRSRRRRRPEGAWLPCRPCMHRARAHHSPWPTGVCACPLVTQDYMIDLDNPHKGVFQKLGDLFHG